MITPEISLRRKEIRIQARSIEIQSTERVLLALIDNPVVEIVAAYIIIEYLQKKGYIPNVAGNIAEAGVLAAVGLQQLAPLAPAIAAGGQALSGVIKAAGGVAAIGAL